MRAVVFTLGCKVNEAESASIMSALEKMGWDTDDRLSYADIYILNTCAVTREAERKSRQLIARVKKYNPQAEIFVCGCASEKDGQSFLSKGATFVCGARRKQEIIDAVAERYNAESVSMPYPKQTKTRAFIKIQDGCNNFCSYCIIPYLRGREVSRPVQEIIDEINSTDCPEIVLNGINISSYEGGLETLIRALKDTDKRIRLGSLECSVISDTLLNSLKQLKDFAPQFHLSLQSGSNAVLKAMNRHYTREEYIEKCKKIYSYFPSAAITTDIIAGFATETDADFEDSLSIIDEVGFARIHAFAYSPREGTVAYRLKDISPEIKSKRLHALLDKARKSADKYVEKYLGTEREIIAEEVEDGYTSGYTDNYIRVYIGESLAVGRKYRVKLIKAYKDGVLAVNER